MRYSIHSGRVGETNGRELTLFMYSSALIEIISISVPMINCMGIIQDLRRPIEGKKSESTMGDQSNFNE